MYTVTKKQIGEELRKRILQKQSIATIGSWAHSMYLKDIADTDPQFNQLLLDLGTMELGSEFEYSYEYLLVVADKIIAGQSVKLC